MLLGVQDLSERVTDFDSYRFDEANQVEKPVQTLQNHCIVFASCERAREQAVKPTFRQGSSPHPKRVRHGCRCISKFKQLPPSRRE